MCDSPVRNFRPSRCSGLSAVQTQSLCCCIPVATKLSILFAPKAWPGFIEAAKAGKSKYQMGDGSNKMDWSYVENVAMAHVLAADVLLRKDSRADGEVGIERKQPSIWLMHA